MKIVKLLLNLFLIFFCYILQTSFFSQLSFFSHLNLLLCLLIFFAIFDFSSALGLCLIGGLLIDFQSILPLGFFIIIFAIISLITRFLAKNFFSSQQFFPLLLLILISLIVYFLLSYFFVLILHAFALTSLPIILNKNYLFGVLFSLILNTALILVFIYSRKQKRTAHDFVLPL